MSRVRGEWHHAFDLLQAELKVHDPTPFVVRVEARADGTQVWTTKEEDGTSWFLYSSGQLHRLQPVSDPKLPGAAKSLRGKVIAWRPGRRAVAVGPDGRTIWKLFRKNRLPSAVLRHRLALEGCMGAKHWRVPRILSVDERRARVQFERIDGAEIGVKRNESHKWKPVGAGLREFQAGVRTADLHHHDRRLELDTVSQLHQRYAQLFERRLSSVDRLLERLEGWVQPTTTSPPVAVHRDLHDGQFLAKENGHWVLDFDQLCAGEAELDLANLTAHFVLRDMQAENCDHAEGAEACSLSLISGYEIPNSNSAHQALRFYQAATFVRLALLYQFRPKWRHLFNPLIQRAVASVDELRHA